MTRGVIALTLAALKGLLGDIRFQDWIFSCGQMKNLDSPEGETGYYIQILFSGRCSVECECGCNDPHLYEATNLGTRRICGSCGCDEFKGKLKSWTSRKWYVSAYSTKDEVVQTCLKAVLTALEHEAREQFLYKGVPIFQPHISIDALVDIAKTKVTRS